jgi:uncharacterized protein (TIGR02145 family)
MVENLKTSRYNDGTVISLISDVTLWEAASTNGAPAYCWHDTTGTNYATYSQDTFGALYNWYAVDTLSNGDKNICPSGWHVPTDGEWTTLTTFLGGEGVAGGKMKEEGLANWTRPNTGATNESGFVGLPGGKSSFNGTFDYIGNYGIWWNSTEYNATSAWSRYLRNSDDDVYRGIDNEGVGFSVRCLRD